MSNDFQWADACKPCLPKRQLSHLQSIHRAAKLQEPLSKLVKLAALLQILPEDAGDLRRYTAYLSRGKGLGSGRIAAMEERGCLAGEGMEKFKSKEPVFLCRGSSPMAPCISLSIGHEPALPWLEREESSGPTAPCRTPSMAAWGSCVGDTDGGERDFFFVDAPARSFSSPLFFSFCKGTK